MALNAGVLSATGQIPTKIFLATTVATEGTGTPHYQLQKSAHDAGSWSDVGEVQDTLTWEATGLTASTTYDFRVLYTDDASGTATSNTVAHATDEAYEFEFYLWGAGGIPTIGGGSSVIGGGSSIIGGGSSTIGGGTSIIGA